FAFLLAVMGLLASAPAQAAEDLRAEADEARGYPSPAQVRSAFLKLLDRPRVPLDIKVGRTVTARDGFVHEQLTFASEKKADGSIERVPVLIVRPAKVERKLPAVIVLHGTGGSASSQAGFLSELAKRNIIGVAIDARYHGARPGGARAATPS